MKSQTDWIVTIVAAVLGIAISLTMFFMKRDPVTPAAPQQVVTTKLAWPAAAPVMADSLPGGGGGGAGGGNPFGAAGGPPGGGRGAPSGIMGAGGGGGGRPTPGSSGRGGYGPGG